MSKLKPLNPQDFSMPLIKDLGMINKARKAIFACSICEKHIEGNVSAAKNRQINKCKSCSNRLNSTIHGKSHTKLYYIWGSMLSRCNNKRHQAYHNYGGRGIKVLDDFKDFNNFEQWALNSGYDGVLTLDREDNNGNYTASNCRWATKKEQRLNQRV